MIYVCKECGLVWDEPIDEYNGTCPKCGDDQTEEMNGDEK